jgi:hypothetical protein
VVSACEEGVHFSVGFSGSSEPRGEGGSRFVFLVAVEKRWNRKRVMVSGGIHLSEWEQPARSQCGRVVL